MRARGVHTFTEYKDFKLVDIFMLYYDTELLVEGNNYCHHDLD
jgi:hypothetical protein